MGSQTGTHVDAPYHFDAATPRLDELPLELFLGPAVVVDASGLGARMRITWDHVAPVADRLGPGTIVLLRTDWSHRYGQPAYFDNPYLDAEAGGVIGENFRNLELVDWADPFVMCLPIALERADGGPVRAVAVEMRP